MAGEPAGSRHSANAPASRCWPLWPFAMHSLCMGAAISRQHSRAIVTASMLLPVRASQLQVKGPEDGPALSPLSSLPLPFPLSVSQMAILLTASKKTLHATVHMCPEMLMGLFESQPWLRLKICPLSPFRCGPAQTLRTELSAWPRTHRPPAAPGHRALAALGG